MTPKAPKQEVNVDCCHHHPQVLNVPFFLVSSTLRSQALFFPRNPRALPIPFDSIYPRSYNATIQTVVVAALKRQCES